jgi:hypothetical protein
MTMRTWVAVGRTFVAEQSLDTLPPPWTHGAPGPAAREPRSVTRPGLSERRGGESEGAAGVAGGGFIALTATLSTVGTIPAAGIMLVFGIDEVMSECRALVNLCDNAVGTLFITHWDRTLDRDRARRMFRGDDVPPLHESDEAPQEPDIADTGPTATPHPVAGVAAVPVGARA